MKKYVLVFAAIGLLVACNGRRQQGPVVVAEQVTATWPDDSPSVNMRDSLVMENNKGAVVERQYSGLLPGADVPGIEYDLTLFYQQDSENGVFALRTTYLDADNGEDVAFRKYGKRRVVRGVPGDANAIVYQLIPNDGEEAYNFRLMQNGDLTLIDQDMRTIHSDHNYTLKLTR